MAHLRGSPCDPTFFWVPAKARVVVQSEEHPLEIEALGLGTWALLPSGDSVGPGPTVFWGGLGVGAQEPCKLGKNKGWTLGLSFSPSVILEKVALPLPASVSPSAHRPEDLL